MGNEIVTELIQINDYEFQLIADLIYKKCGINLTPKKKLLVMGRLNKVVKQMGFNSFKQFFDFVVNDKSNQSLMLMVDKLTTNHSYFFRESKHFDYLIQQVLPVIKNNAEQTGIKNLKIWCAGCATGEEAYTLSMILHHYFMHSIADWDIGILATDISMTALLQSVTGSYNLAKLKNLPVNFRHQYFKMIDPGQFMVIDEIKKMILFKRLNLMQERYPFKHKFDLIFCRNVMIYFDLETKTRQINRFYECLKNNGYLFVGHSESIRRDESPFRYVQPAVYQKIN